MHRNLKRHTNTSVYKMRSISKALALSAIFFSPLSFAEVVVHLNQGTSILAVNGQNIEDTGLFDSKGKVQLPNGKNQILVEYTAEIGKDAEDIVLETSESYVLLFEAKDQNLRLQTPKIKSYYDLNEFNSTPQWKIVDAQGKTIKYQSAILAKEGFQLARNYENELKVFNQSGSSAALASLQVERHQFNESPVVKNQPASTPKTDQKMIGEMLQYWYQQADENTRNNFKSWINTSLK